MRLRRRWPVLLVLLALAGCGWAAWRIHAVGRPIEEAYARIQPGMTPNEVAMLLEPVASRLVINDLQSGGQMEGWWDTNRGYFVWVTYGDPSPFPTIILDVPVGSVTTVRNTLGVSRAEIQRPDWTARLKLAFGF